MCLTDESLDVQYIAYQKELLEAGLLVSSSIPGVYGLSGVFERIVEAFEKYVTRMGEHLSPEVISFPPVFSRRSYESTGHLDAFPNLMGSVHTFQGTESDHLNLARRKSDGQDWSQDLNATE